MARFDEDTAYRVHLQRRSYPRFAGATYEALVSARSVEYIGICKIVANALSPLSFGVSKRWMFLGTAERQYCLTGLSAHREAQIEGGVHVVFLAVEMCETGQQHGVSSSTVP